MNEPLCPTCERVLVRLYDMQDLPGVERKLLWNGKFQCAKCHPVDGWYRQNRMLVGGLEQFRTWFVPPTQSTPAMLAALDPGIRDVVAQLVGAGFCTTDSGDGVSKVEAIASGDALAFRHVACQVQRTTLIPEADRLQALLGSTWRVEGSYHPADNGTCLLFASEIEPVPPVRPPRLAACGETGHVWFNPFGAEWRPDRGDYCMCGDARWQMPKDGV